MDVVLLVLVLIVQLSRSMSTSRCPCGFRFILTINVALVPSAIKVVIPVIVLHRKRQKVLEGFFVSFCFICPDTVDHLINGF